MVTITALPSRLISIGRRGENEHRRVAFDISEYLAQYPDATFGLIHSPSGVTARANEHYVRFYFNPGPYSQIQDSTWDSIDIQIERGGMSTAYEPYIGADYTINWASEAGTVYGGAVDLVTGVLVSEYTANGSLLPTKVRYQLSPTRIETLAGVNNIWSDAGSVSIKYWAN